MGNMSEISKVRDDLSYVRQAVEKGERPGSPASIYFLWAAIVLAGFTINDLAPAWANPFWAVAAPAGFAASAVLGYRSSRRQGQADREEGVRWMLHWGGLMAAILLSGLSVLRGGVDWDGFGATIVLLAGLSYFLAGVHLDRRLFWIAPVMAAGYAVVLLVPGRAWTLAGVLVALALASTGLAARRRDGGARA